MLSKPEEIVIEYLRDPEDLRRALFLNRIELNDAVRQAFMSLGSAKFAYIYAYNIDKKPNDDTREICCKDPHYAFKYAKYVDKCPRDDTRAAACAEPGYAFSYFRFIDEQPSAEVENAIFRTNLDMNKFYKYIRNLGDDTIFIAYTTVEFFRSFYKEFLEC